MDREQFDLLVLDWHLPDTTGIEELDWLRGVKASNTPVIFITSRDSEESVVEALDHGADDYMVKPVKKEVTLARIKALQRRNRLANTAALGSGQTEPAAYQADSIDVFAPYQINQEEHTISKTAKWSNLPTRSTNSPLICSTMQAAWCHAIIFSNISGACARI